jgi:hypothetical protein
MRPKRGDEAHQPDSDEAHQPGSDEAHQPGSDEAHQPGSDEAHQPDSDRQGSGVSAKGVPLSDSILVVNEMRARARKARQRSTLALQTVLVSAAAFMLFFALAGPIAQHDTSILAPGALRAAKILLTANEAQPPSRIQSVTNETLEMIDQLLRESHAQLSEGETKAYLVSLVSTRIVAVALLSALMKFLFGLSRYQEELAASADARADALALIRNTDGLSVREFGDLIQAVDPRVRFIKGRESGP